LAYKLQEKWQQSVTIDNRLGANTLIGVEAVAYAKDPSTLLLTTDASFTINPHLYKVSYSIEKDFEYIALFVKFPTLLVVKKDFPANDAKQAMEYIRKNGPSLNYASYGSGSVAHIGMEMLLNRLNTKSNHIPYKGGAPAIQDMVGGNVDMMMDVIPSSLPQAKAGNLKILAWTGKDRNVALPETMTLQEAGISGFDFFSWQGIIAPGGTPELTKKILSDAFNKALASSQVKEKLESRGIDPAYLDGPAFRKLAISSNIEMQKTILLNKIKAE
jgi:tripartite-type tricarboxylate transporter receptor subunit TctC